jgi:hypothetical protein
MHMSEVDLPGRVEKYGGVVDITRIALTMDDCTDALPSFNVATKQKDPRYRWFRQNYGQRCWELDAMNPNDLRGRVRDAILSRIDIDAWKHCQAVEKAERESLNAYVRAWPKSNIKKKVSFLKPVQPGFDFWLRVWVAGLCLEAHRRSNSRG